MISPYNAQVRHLRKLLVEQLGPELGRAVEVNSVDGFQGREKEVIILSCVRSDRQGPNGAGGGKRGIGFLKDARRMNVSITRARRSVFVLGHAQTLKEDALWEATLHDASERACLVRTHSPLSIWFESACKEARSEAADGAGVDGGDGSQSALAVGESMSAGAVRAKGASAVQKCGQPSASAAGRRRGGGGAGGGGGKRGAKR